MAIFDVSSSAPVEDKYSKRSAEPQPQNPLGLLIPPRNLKPRRGQPVRNLVRAGIAVNNVKALNNILRNALTG